MLVQITNACSNKRRFSYFQMQDLAESQKEEDQQKDNAGREEAALEGGNGAIQSEGSAAESSP